ncbi:F0F1 ATP synthase subunit B [Tissierella carlieri]|uniref:ATP synthase subunit b n=1 Tax=Tissierella carlieri TaxID=689904 RepID=A0ABT1S9N5_9FIRM|nr:F0F1 ATP synthase subunit B [Tissierella carlieri]MCQ4923181.1 F0F1 ATP synthase subunit B [Tissierella carlieri]
MFEVRALPVLSSMILAWAALLLLYLMLRHFLYKPVSQFLNDRKEKIKSDIDGAKVLKEEAIALRDDYESRISLAKKESQEIIESARKRGEELKEGILAEAKKEAEGIVSRARKEIAREREVAFQDIKSQAGEIAILIASKIMEEEIKIDKQKSLIDKFIDEVGSSKWQS